MIWKTLSSEYISKEKYFTARKDVCEMPNGQIIDSYYVIELPTSACAVAITEDNKIILLQQYRHPMKGVMLEIPGGFVDAGETPEQGMARELMEETGYAFSSVEFLARVTSNPGLVNNYTDLFLATGGKKVASQELDDNEEIEVKLFPLDEVKKMLMNNEIKQSLHSCALFYAFAKLESAK